MHETQERLLELARQQDLSRVPLREIAELIDKKQMSPGVLQHHFGQLEKKNLLFIDRRAKTQRLGDDVGDDRFYTIPIVGAASCGPADTVADESIEGYLKISKSSLFGGSGDLIAVRASGNSMNNAQVLTAGGRKAPINDGDYVIVDRKQLSLQDNINKYVLSIIGGMANIKKLVRRDYDIALLSESTDQKSYPPIIIHEGDDYLVNGRVVQVVEA